MLSLREKKAFSLSLFRFLVMKQISIRRTKCGSRFSRLVFLLDYTHRQWMKKSGKSISLAWNCNLLDVNFAFFLSLSLLLDCEDFATDLIFIEKIQQLRKLQRRLWNVKFIGNSRSERSAIFLFGSLRNAKTYEIIELPNDVDWHLLHHWRNLDGSFRH